MQTIYKDGKSGDVEPFDVEKMRKELEKASVDHVRVYSGTHAMSKKAMEKSGRKTSRRRR